MKLTTFHQVLIVGAIALCGILALRGVTLCASSQCATQGVVAAVALLGGGGLAIYLKRFRRKLAQNRDPE